MLDKIRKKLILLDVEVIKTTSLLRRQMERGKRKRKKEKEGKSKQTSTIEMQQENKKIKLKRRNRKLNWWKEEKRGNMKFTEDEK